MGFQQAQMTTNMLNTVKPGALQAFRLSCVKQRHVPADCRLVVYYNSTGTLEDGVSSMDGLIKPPFGVLSGQLPNPRAAWNSALFNKTEPQLNRTEVLWNATNWPMLYFYGGRSCHVLLPAPFIKGVQLPNQDGEGSQVRQRANMLCHVGTHTRTFRSSQQLQQWQQQEHSAPSTQHPCYKRTHQCHTVFPMHLLRLYCRCWLLEGALRQQCKAAASQTQLATLG